MRETNPVTMRPLGAAEIVRAEEVARGIAEWVMAFTRANPPSMIATKKHPADFVTNIDLSVEMWVRDTIAQAFPDHAVVGEEYGAGAESSSPRWYCDPVDGTTNSAAGIPWSSFSLALVDGLGPAVAVVVDPWRMETFTAVRGHGAYLGERRLTGSATSSLEGAVVLTEWDGHRPWPGMLEMLSRLSDVYCTTRIMGSSTLSVAGVAAGRGVGAVIGRFEAVDLLAAALICHEAGCRVWDENGEANMFPAGGGLMVAAPGVSGEVFRAWLGRAPSQAPSD